MWCAFFWVLGLLYIPNSTASGACANGWQKFGERCFFFSRRETIWNFASGEAKCRSKHQLAHLASIHSKQEHNFIAARAERRGRGTYIGASDQAHEGRWVWSDGSPWDYTNWSPPGPSNTNGWWGNGEDCAMIWNDNKRLWNDMACNYHFPGSYVCSYNLNECADGWKKVGNKCFFIGTGTVKKASEAEWICGNLNPTAHLASIENQSENSVVAGSMVTSGAFIGASDKAREGVWVWADGSPFNYKNWNNGEPDNHENKEDCAQILRWHEGQRGKWSDVPCAADYLRSYVCSYKLK